MAWPSSSIVRRPNLLSGWKGLSLAEDQLARQAAQAGTTPAQLKAMRQHRYKDIAAALKQQSDGGM